MPLHNLEAPLGEFFHTSQIISQILNLTQWTNDRAGGVPPSQTVWVGGIPEDISTQALSEEISTLELLGRVKCMERHYSPDNDKWYALCYSEWNLTEGNIPDMLDLGSDLSPWTLQKVISLPELPRSQSDFRKKLQTWLEGEGKTLDDLHEVAGVEIPSSTTTSQELLVTIGKALERALKPSPEGTSYKY